MPKTYRIDLTEVQLKTIMCALAVWRAEDGACYAPECPHFRDRDARNRKAHDRLDEDAALDFIDTLTELELGHKLGEG